MLLDKGSMCAASSLRYTGAKIQRWEKEPRYKYLYRDKRENKSENFLFGTGMAYQKERERQDSRESIAGKKMRHTSGSFNLTGVSCTPLTNLHPSIQISCFLFPLLKQHQSSFRFSLLLSHTHLFGHARVYIVVINKKVSWQWALHTSDGL